MPNVVSIDRPSLTQSASSRWQCSIETLLVLAVFALHAGWPIPDVNEAHYLAKAKHFWNHDWLAQDFFLQTPSDRGGSALAESHLLFYVATGWLSRFVSLYWSAVLGRTGTWLLLAWTWRRLSVALLPVRWLAPLSAALFVALGENFQMAGEWVIGGLEAKELAFPFVFLAIEGMVRGAWRRACLFAGVATALHVLVGGWTAVLIVAVWLGDPVQQPKPGQFLWAMAVLVALGAVGLIPALALDWGTDAQTLAESRYIYVYQRLPHHLLPGYFPIDGVTKFSLLFLVWLFFTWHGPGEPGWRRLQRFTLYSVAIAAFGVLLSWLTWHLPDWQARFMRYYWFRSADAMLPLGTTFAWFGAALYGSHLQSSLGRLSPKGARGEESDRPSRLVVSLRNLNPRMLGRLFVPFLVATVYLALHGRAVMTAARPRADAPSKVISSADWKDACRWVANNTPADAMFITPRTSQTFKWWAERGEVATWKDLPQDAHGILEWWKRLVDIYERDEYASNAWKYDTPSDLTPARLRELGAKYHAQYVITEISPTLALPRLYANGTYAIYSLKK